MRTNPTIEDQFEQHFNVTGDGSVKSQLHVLKLRESEDGGMYYCAASRHSDTNTFLPLQKPSLITLHWGRAHLHLTAACSRKSLISALKPPLPVLTNTTVDCINPLMKRCDVHYVDSSSSFTSRQLCSVCTWHYCFVFICIWIMIRLLIHLAALPFCLIGNITLTYDIWF